MSFETEEPNPLTDADASFLNPSVDGVQADSSAELTLPVGGTHLLAAQIRVSTGGMTSGDVQVLIYAEADGGRTPIGSSQAAGGQTTDFIAGDAAAGDVRQDALGLFIGHPLPSNFTILVETNGFGDAAETYNLRASVIFA